MPTVFLNATDVPPLDPATTLGPVKSIAQLPDRSLMEMPPHGLTDGTPVIVENIVNRIAEVVRGVRFDGWQSTIRGDQEVRQALRKTLYVQFKIRDNDVFDKALGYVREYY